MPGGILRYVSFKDGDAVVSSAANSAAAATVFSRRDSLKLQRTASFSNGGAVTSASDAPLRQRTSIMVKRRVTIASPGSNDGTQSDVASVPLSTIERIRRMQTFEEMLYSVAPSFPAAHHHLHRQSTTAVQPKRKRGNVRGQAWVQLAFKSQSMENSMSLANLWMLAFGLLGLVFSIVANEVCFDFGAH